MKGLMFLLLRAKILEQQPGHPAREQNQECAEKTVPLLWAQQLTVPFCLPFLVRAVSEV